MANIAITTYCNLHCPYCFANTMITEEQIKNISLEQFEKTLKWIGNNNQKIGIIGGEPTLHPQFELILQKINEYHNHYPESHFVLFTNGVYLDKYWNIIPDYMSILVNVNEPKAMPAELYERMINNIKIMNQLGWLNNHQRVCKVTLGCNLCPQINNYQFFWNIVNETKIQSIRMSVTAPTDEYYSYNKYQYYNDMKPILLQFAKDAWKYHTYLNLDCNQIPVCFFTEEELLTINKVLIFPLETSVCEPVIDITPDFKASSCFGAYQLIDCDKFSNVGELTRYIHFKIMYPKILNNTDKPCKNCEKHKLLLCQGGCLSFSHFK